MSGVNVSWTVEGDLVVSDIDDLQPRLTVNFWAWRRFVPDKKLRLLRALVEAALESPDLLDAVDPARASSRDGSTRDEKASSGVLTDDLIARLREMAGKSHMWEQPAVVALLREAAEALAAASRPRKEPDDLDPRVAGERLPEGQDLPRSSQRGHQVTSERINQLDIIACAWAFESDADFDHRSKAEAAAIYLARGVRELTSALLRAHATPAAEKDEDLPSSADVLGILKPYRESASPAAPPPFGYPTDWQAIGAEVDRMRAAGLLPMLRASLPPAAPPQWQPIAQAIERLDDIVSTVCSRMRDKLPADARTLRYCQGIQELATRIARDAIETLLRPLPSQPEPQLKEPKYLPCGRCGRAHEEYSIDSPIWNAVMRADGVERDEYLCIDCFDELATGKGVTGWEAEFHWVGQSGSSMLHVALPLPSPPASRNSGGMDDTSHGRTGEGGLDRRGVSHPGADRAVAPPSMSPPASAPQPTESEKNDDDQTRVDRE